MSIAILGLKLKQRGGRANFFTSKLEEAIDRNQDRIIQGRHDNLPPYQEDELRALGENRIKVFDWVALTTFPEEMRLQEHLLALAALDDTPSAAKAAVHAEDLTPLRLD